MFCIIELNVGDVVVFDDCLFKIVDIVKFVEVIFICINFVDIVGFVSGVFKGEGLGN